MIPWKESVVYQIYPWSFKDTNGDGIGDLRGIIQKLDYFKGSKNSLGIDVLWLTPIFKSPMVDFGYDIENFYEIDPIFGSMSDLDELIQKAHQYELRVLLDFVPNHTSDQHPYFIKSRSSLKNPFRDFYIWANPKIDGSPPNNWLSVFGGSAWELDKKTQQYYLHSFLKEQPDLNWRNPRVIKEMDKILKFWLQKGVDGFRMDAVDHMYKDSLLRDEPPNPNYIKNEEDPTNAFLHIYTKGLPEVQTMIHHFSEVLERFQDRFMVTEAYGDLELMQRYYRACPNKLYSPFNFNFLNLPWDAQAYKLFVDSFEKSLSKTDIPNYVLGNHDRSRVASRIGQNQAKVAAMLQLTLRGIAFIYYGDELGMKDSNIADEKNADPWGRNVPGFKLGRDPERTPMQWNTKKYSGFSSVKPWLPVAKNYLKSNVETELQNPKSMLALYRQLLKLRHNLKVLQTGAYQQIDNTPKAVFAFNRILTGENILVLANFSSQNQKTGILGKAKILLSTYLDKKEYLEVDLNTLILRPNEGYILT